MQQERLSEYPSPVSLELQLERRAVIGNGIGMVGTPEPEAVLLLIWSQGTDVNSSDISMQPQTTWWWLEYISARLFMPLIVADWNIFPLEFFYASHWKGIAL